MEELKACPFCGGKYKLTKGVSLESPVIFKAKHKCSQSGLTVETQWRKTVDEVMADITTRAEPDNPPLTEQQIRERVGKPVWVEPIGMEELSHWNIVKSFQGDIAIFDGNYRINLKDINKYYNLYDHQKGD